LKGRVCPGPASRGAGEGRRGCRAGRRCRRGRACTWRIRVQAAATRIQGALQNLGHEIGRDTIAKILKEAGVEPAPDRQRGTTWKEFLKSHWEVLAAADFFTVEVWTALGLIR